MASLQRSGTQPPGTVVLHGVRRVPGGTVVYYSVSTAPGEASGRSFSDFASPDLTFDYTQYTGKIALFDGENAYLPLRADDETGSRRLAIMTRFSDRKLDPGAFYTAYVVLPELPADIAAVDVLVGDIGVIPAVSVEDGLLTPTVDGTRPVPLGAYWPAVDLARVAAGDDTGRVVPLEKRVEDLDGATVTTEHGSEGTVDLSADVLFAVDRAILSPRASAKIRAAAQTINAKARSGDTITIAGHTDSTGSTSHNLDLSRRRAQAVAASLKPLVTVPGVTYLVEGKGESEPVASNDTEEGRQENRRVSISFTIKES